MGGGAEMHQCNSTNSFKMERRDLVDIINLTKSNELFRSTNINCFAFHYQRMKT